MGLTLAEASSAVALMIKGAPGTVAGVTALLIADVVPPPNALKARTLKV